MGREDSGASATPPWIDAAGVEEREPARNSCGRTARGRSAEERRERPSALSIRLPLAGDGALFLRRVGGRAWLGTLGRSVGFVGGQAGAALGNPAASHVRLVLEGTNVITAFPVIP
jgi:hypothetical protein